MIRRADFYFGSDDCASPLGHIQLLGKSHAAMFRANAPRLTPGPVLGQMAKHALDFWLTPEELVDASFFVSSSAVNPGLTTIANALRVGDHLKERLA